MNNTSQNSLLNVKAILTEKTTSYDLLTLFDIMEASGFAPAVPTINGNFAVLIGKKVFDFYTWEGAFEFIINCQTICELHCAKNPLYTQYLPNGKSKEFIRFTKENTFIAFCSDKFAKDSKDFILFKTNCK